MKHFLKTATLLITLLLFSALCLCGCSSVSSDSEESTATLKYNGEMETDTEAVGDQEEDSSYNTETIDTAWGNYEVSTNDIDYQVGEELLDPDGYYTSEEDVATYIVEYGTLPENFITKKEAKALGWSGGGLDDYADGCSIGGDYFGNYEGLLPQVDGRTYYECDIDTMNKNKRGSKRIIFSDDGQIYYTDDHYESFDLIYGTDE